MLGDIDKIFDDTGVYDSLHITHKGCLKLEPISE